MSSQLPSVRITRKLLSVIGLAHESDLIRAEWTNTNLSRQLETLQERLAKRESEVQALKSTCNELKSQLTDAKRAQDDDKWWRDWAPPTMAEFHQQTNLRRATLEQLRLAIPAAQVLTNACDHRNFAHLAHWVLYWIITWANGDTVKQMLKAHDEDALSDYWCQSIAKYAGYMSDRVSGIEIAYDAIHRHIKPAVKEKAVGSDILLLIGGKGFFHNGGGYRAIWIQAKRTADAAYTLDFLSNKNSDGHQYEALEKVDNRENGSVGIYMLFSAKLHHIPSIAVESMQKQVAKSKSLDLAIHGCRLQELLLGTMARNDIGHFTTSGQLTDFLNKVGKNAPYSIVRIASSGRELELLKEVSDYYYEQLGLELQREHHIEHDIEYDM